MVTLNTFVMTEGCRVSWSSEMIARLNITHLECLRLHLTNNWSLTPVTEQWLLCSRVSSLYNYRDKFLLLSILSSQIARASNTHQPYIWQTLDIERATSSGTYVHFSRWDVHCGSSGWTECKEVAVVFNVSLRLTAAEHYILFIYPVHCLVISVLILGA